MWDYFESHQQMKELYIGKMKLRDALYGVMKAVFPCKKFIWLNFKSDFWTVAVFIEFMRSNIIGIE